MELEKKKYTKSEVLLMLNAYKSEFEKRYLEQREIISQLNAEIKVLSANAEDLNQKEKLILATLVRAEKTALDLKKEATEQYELEIERLKRFSKKWNAYFKELKEKYPLYQPIQNAIDINNELNTNKGEPKEVIEKLSSMLPKDEDKPFNPKSKIKDYIAATTDNGFNLDEVLNPGELHLEDLCKELGLIDGEE